MNMIEKVSRIICRQRGHDPDRRMQDYGKTSHAYYAWEGFREDAKENIRWTGARRPDVAAGCASSHFGYKRPGKQNANLGASSGLGEGGVASPVRGTGRIRRGADHFAILSTQCVSQKTRRCLIWRWRYAARTTRRPRFSPSAT